MSSSSNLPSTISDAELVRRLAAAHEVAAGTMEVLMSQHAEALLDYAAVFMSTDDGGADIVQDVFTWVWEHRTQIKLRESWRFYLIKAVRHRALNVRRGEQSAAERNARYVQSSVGDNAPGSQTPLVHLEHHELASAIRTAMNTLPERRRMILRLRWREHSTREIAELLGISTKTVEAQITTAYATLRDHLRGWLSKEG